MNFMRHYEYHAISYVVREKYRMSIEVTRKISTISSAFMQSFPSLNFLG